MGRIPEETLQTIRDRIDLVDLVGRAVTLKKAGRSWKGLCPFHDEKTPSFTVNPDRGVYHCFGCGESGNAFSFVMRHENLTFPEAARMLASHAGVEIPETGGRDSGMVERILRANEVAQRLFRSALASPAGEAARAYLERRGLGGDEAARYGIGWAPPGWEDLARALAGESVSAEDGARAGLLRERERGGYYGLLRDRVTFPIQDARGRVVGFGGRALAEGQEPKYLNSPETPVFRKREGFYGFPRALEAMRRAERAVVVEGYFDQIALDRAGLGEAVATCGTALSDEHARNLRRRARNVVLLFDGDAAGRRAAIRALEVLLPHGLRVRAAALAPGEDPDSLLLREGPDALRARVDAAPPALDLAIADAVAAGCATPEQKADAVQAVVPLLALVADPTERSGWCQRLALAVGAREADVLHSVRAVARGASAEEAVREAAPPPRGPTERQLRTLLGALLQHPACAGSLAADDLLVAGVEAFWQGALPRVLEACREGRDPLAEPGLPPHAGAVLHALAADEGPSYADFEHARTVVAQTAERFARLRRRERQRELTDRLRASSQDEALDLLRSKVSAEVP